MTKPIPQIKKYMTPCPRYVEKDQSLFSAATMMHEQGFRHLPVIDKGQIVGILSMTDMNVAMTFQGADINKLDVEDVYTPNPFKVNPDVPVDEVCRIMAQKKYGCVLVEDNKKLVGILTWIDALRAMDELLHTRLK